MSSSEITHYHHEYKVGVAVLGDLVKSLEEKTNKEEKDAIIAEFQTQAESLKEVAKSFKLETRLLKDRSERSKYETEGSVLDKKIAHYKGTLPSCVPFSFIHSFIHSSFHPFKMISR